MVSNLHKNIRFYVESWSGCIVTPGIDYGGKITVMLTKGDLQLWQKAAGSSWGGRGMPRHHVPKELWVVRISGDRFTALAVEEVSRKRTSKSLETELLEAYFSASHPTENDPKEVTKDAK